LSSQPREGTLHPPTASSVCLQMARLSTPRAFCIRSTNSRTISLDSWPRCCLSL
jgi:hypothetical protein